MAGCGSLDPASPGTKRHPERSEGSRAGRMLSSKPRSLTWFGATPAASLLLLVRVDNRAAGFTEIDRIDVANRLGRPELHMPVKEANVSEGVEIVGGPLSVTGSDAADEKCLAVW